MYDDNADPVVIFSQFSDHLIDKNYPLTTRDRYTIVAAQFLDYLSEVTPPSSAFTEDEVKSAIDNYMDILVYGESLSDEGLLNVAIKLHRTKPLAKKSWSNTLSALNLFFEFSRDTAQKEHSLLRMRYPDAFMPDLSSFYTKIKSSKEYTQYEKASLVQNSVLGSCIRLVGKVKKPRTGTVSSPMSNKISLTKTETAKAYPWQDIPFLLEAAISSRDKVMFSLLAGAGLRLSEAELMTWDHVDKKALKVWIDDPDNLRFGKDSTNIELVRFKGRTTSIVTFWAPMKTYFFEALADYGLNEYMPNHGHNFIFQIKEGDKSGQPLLYGNRSSFIKSLKRTVVRAEKLKAKKCAIKGEIYIPKWDNFNDVPYSPHSLRHTYGDYMRNWVPIPGGTGLSLQEVQKLMGHKSPLSTEVYAKKEMSKTLSQLEFADRFITENSLELSDYPALIAERLKQEARKIETASTSNFRLEVNS